MRTTRKMIQAGSHSLRLVKTIHRIMHVATRKPSRPAVMPRPYPAAVPPPKTAVRARVRMPAKKKGQVSQHLLGQHDARFAVASPDTEPTAKMMAARKEPGLPNPISCATNRQKNTSPIRTTPVPVRHWCATHSPCRLVARRHGKNQSPSSHCRPPERGVQRAGARRVARLKGVQGGRR